MRKIMLLPTSLPRVGVINKLIADIALISKISYADLISKAELSFTGIKSKINHSAPCSFLFNSFDRF